MTHPQPAPTLLKLTAKKFSKELLALSVTKTRNSVEEVASDTRDFQVIAKYSFSGLVETASSEAVFEANTS